MFGELSYLISNIILGLPVIIIEWLFFYNMLKGHYKAVFITIICGLIIISISEPLGLYLQVYKYGLQTTLPTFFLGTKLESYLYVIIGSIAVSFATIIYSTYQDRGVKNVFFASLKDLMSMKYTFWKKEIK